MDNFASYIAGRMQEALERSLKGTAAYEAFALRRKALDTFWLPQRHGGGANARCFRSGLPPFYARYRLRSDQFARSITPAKHDPHSAFTQFGHSFLASLRHARFQEFDYDLNQTPSHNRGAQMCRNNTQYKYLKSEPGVTRKYGSDPQSWGWCGGLVAIKRVATTTGWGQSGLV